MWKFFRFTIVIYLLFACSNISISETGQPSTVLEGTEEIPGHEILSTATALPVDPFALENQPSVEIKPSNTPPASDSLPDNVSQLPDPGGFAWVPVVAGLRQPVYLTHAGDGSGRIYIVEQPGVIRILQDGLISPTPYLDIQDRVGTSSSEQGLLGLAFHPEYESNGYLFVNYTNIQGDTIIARYQRSNGNEFQVDTSSEEILLLIPQPYGNHNGGQITFGPDYHLYIGTGDGGSAGDPLGNGQSLNTLLGKILRIDVDSDTPYGIPADNPFNTGTGLPEIWSYGLRNPWRFSFDIQTGDLFIADVGQNNIEEINHTSPGSQSGANYGWNFMEGSQIFSGPVPDDAALTLPVTEYSHELGCSITGGYVYRGNLLPEFFGVYIFGDYCTGHVWGMVQDGNGNWQTDLLFENAGRISSFGVDEDGEIYLVDHTGPILKLAKK